MKTPFWLKAILTSPVWIPSVLFCAFLALIFWTCGNKFGHCWTTFMNHLSEAMQTLNRQRRGGA